MEGNGDELERVVAEVPAELKQLVEADSRTIRETVQAALWTEFGGHPKSALEQREEEIEERIKTIQSEIQSREQEIEEQRQKLETVRSKISEMEQSDSVYQTRLDELLDEMAQGTMCVWADHPKVREIATQHDQHPDRILEDLQDRADERDLGMADHRFQQGNGVGL